MEHPDARGRAVLRNGAWDGNLYALRPAATVGRHIDAVEPSAASVVCLARQLAEAPEASWADFHLECRRRQPGRPVSLPEALRRVRVRRARAADIAPGAYGLCSMRFVAESVTEDRDEFHALCGRFIGPARPGGHLVAAFVESMGAGPVWGPEHR